MEQTCILVEPPLMCRAEGISRVRIDIYAWIPHAQVVNPDPLTSGTHFRGDGWITPPDNSSSIPGTYRVHQWLEFAIEEQDSGRISILDKDYSVGRSEALDSSGQVVRTDYASPNSEVNRAEWHQSTNGAHVAMRMDVGIPLASVAALTPDIEWDLDLDIGHRGDGAFTFRSKQFPSYVVYATVDGLTKRLWWQDVSSVSPSSATQIGSRLARYGDTIERQFRFP